MVELPAQGDEFGLLGEVAAGEGKTIGDSSGARRCRRNTIRSIKRSLPNQQLKNR
jgi:hypothetical protein